MSPLAPLSRPSVRSALLAPLLVLGFLFVLLRPAAAQQALPDPGRPPSANPLCDGTAVPCLDIDDLAAHAYLHLQVLPLTDQRDTVAVLPFGIALGLFGRVAGGISTHYILGKDYQQFGPLRLNLTVRLWPLRPLWSSGGGTETGEGGTTHYAPPRGLQLGLAYEHEVRVWNFDGANSLGLLTDLAALRLVASRMFGPVQVSASLGALYDWHGQFATGEAAAQVGLFMPGFRALKIYFEALGRGVPAYVQKDALLLGPVDQAPIHAQSLLGLGLSFHPHARVDLGVLVQRENVYDPEAPARQQGQTHRTIELAVLGAVTKDRTGCTDPTGYVHPIGTQYYREHGHLWICAVPRTEEQRDSRFLALAELPQKMHNQTTPLGRIARALDHGMVKKAQQIDKLPDQVVDTADGGAQGRITAGTVVGTIEAKARYIAEHASIDAAKGWIKGKLHDAREWVGKPPIEQGEDLAERTGDAMIPHPVTVGATVITGGLGRGVLGAAGELEEVAKAGKVLGSAEKTAAHAVGVAAEANAARAGAVALSTVEKDALVRAATQRFKDTALTEAGRALTKHPNVVGLTKETLRKSLRTPEALNAAAEEALGKILHSGTAVVRDLPRFGPTREIRAASGFGARFSQETGEFIDFITP